MQNKSIKILGLSEMYYARQGEDFIGKDKFFTALNRSFDVVEVGNTRLTGLERRKNIIRNFHPDYERWAGRMGVNLKAFEKRTALAQEYLDRHEGQFDLVVQLHCLFAPGFNLQTHPYVIYVDNTYLLSEQYSPTWRVLTKKPDRDEWVRREREMYHQARFIFTWSEFTRQSVIYDYGVPAERVVNAASGANLTRPSIEGKSYDSQTALFVGRDFHRKGGQILLKAWQQVRSRLPQAELQIVGPRLLKGFSQPGIKWLGAVNDRARLEQIYNEASVFVLPSLFDPCPLVLKEAMGLGLPCISTNQCAVPEFVEDGKTGLLVEPGEVDELAQALLHLLSNPDEARQMGFQAQAAVQKGHSWNNVIERMFPFIEEATGVREEVNLVG